MRVVLDSNVVLAAFATEGLCHVLFENCLTNHLLLASAELLEEVRQKLRLKLKLPVARATEIMNYLEGHAHLAVPEAIPASACRDPKDGHILGLAAAAKAQCIVTGDKDLLVLKSFRGIPIYSPREFHTHLQHLK